MKKILPPLSAMLIGLATMALSPLGSAATDPSTTTSNLKWGICGNPAEQTAKHYCTETHANGLCVGGFNEQVIEGCLKRLHSRPACTLRRIKTQMHTIGLTTICKNFPPPSISVEVCKVTVSFFLSHC